MKEKVAAGEELNFSAKIWNEVIDAKNDFLRRKLNTTGISSELPAPPKIQNKTGQSLTKGHVVALDNSALSVDSVKQDIFCFNAKLPDEKPEASFAILTEPCAVDGIAACQTSGTCMAVVNVTDQSHQFAKPYPGTPVLQSAGDGPVRIDANPGLNLGESACIVTIGPSRSQTALAVFSLIEPLTLGGAAGAFICEPGPGGQWLPNPFKPIIVLDSGQVWSGLLGYTGIAFKRPDSEGSIDRYEIVFMQRNDLIVAFRVVIDRQPTDSFMTCGIEYSFQQGNAPPPNSLGFVPIADVQGRFKYAVTGARGLAIWNDRSGGYEAIHCQQRCFLARAFVGDTGGMGDTQAVDGYRVRIEDFQAASPPPFDLAPSQLPETAFNLYRHKGLFGDEMLLAWDEGYGEWVVVDVKKATLNVISDLRLSSDKKKIQAKTISISAEFSINPDDPLNWKDKLDVKTC